MKQLLILLPITIFLSGCLGPKFSYLNDAVIDSYGTLQPFNIDDTYTLYVRQIVLIYDSSTKTYTPSNAITLKKDAVIEIEYMLLSEAHNKVIILNNIPSIYQKIIKEDKKGFNLADNAPGLEIDVWYFRQFRFGEINPGGGFTFLNAANSGKKHVWNCIQSPDSINVTSISITDQYGEDKRNTKEAFALGVLFRRVNAFKLVFTYRKGKRKNMHTFNLKDQTFYLSHPGNKCRVIFRFEQIIDNNDKKNIGFFKKADICSTGKFN